MRTIVAGAATIMLGIQGENEAEIVQFPVVKEWKKLYGDGIFQLMNIRPTEDSTNAYACVLNTTEDNVEWIITNTETANVGTGLCELYYFVNDVLATTYRWETQVLESIIPPGTDVPEPWESWVTDVLQAGSSASQSADEAAQSAGAAADSASAAEGHATSAGNSAVSADNSAKDAEAWAVGQRGGTDVEPEDETYENNSKYYAGVAAASIAGGQYFGFFIDEDGELYVTKTPDSENLDFQINVNTGHLEVVFS